MGRALEGKVAVVAGATRGAGRGVTVELGAAVPSCAAAAALGSVLHRPEAPDACHHTHLGTIGRPSAG